ncbi:MAG: Uncharacterized protein G01um101417_114 [Parcubacteria group bacterium Gr01-1014_17]|nr:MAG: Uncharacterized protein G01um101417_114 [Parcubacteria group bacterium Gr01-1014_17]
MSTFRKRLTLTLSFIVLTGLVSYGIYQARAYLRGPNIFIESTIQSGPLLALAGTAERIAFLSLQGKQIFTNENGRWQETLLLLPGYNSIAIVATDRFGRKTEKHLEAYRVQENI